MMGGRQGGMPDSCNDEVRSSRNGESVVPAGIKSYLKG